MGNHVRVTVEADGAEESARLYESEGEMNVGDATFRFDVGGSDTDDSTDELTAGEHRRRIAPLDAVPTDGTLRCEAFAGKRGVELILYENDGDVYAWRNACPHEPDVRLDPGGGAIFSNDQLVCGKHGARFECGDGVCTAGPCKGDALDRIETELREGVVYLTDDRFDGCRRLDG